MSIKHIVAVLDSDLPGNLKLTAIAYADCADNVSGECWPCYNTVARRASISRRQAITNTQKLESMGVLTTVGGKPTKQGSPVKLRKISMSRLVPSVSGVATKRLTTPSINHHERPLTSINAQHVPMGEDIAPLDRGVKSATPKGEAHDALRVKPTSPRTPIEPLKNPYGQNEFDLAFQAFWKAYPKKVKKKPSRKAFEKAAKDWCKGNIEGLLTSFESKLVNDINLRMKKDRQWYPKSAFIPDPTTYLNQERWDDDIQLPDPKDAPRLKMPETDRGLLDLAKQMKVNTYGLSVFELQKALRQKHEEAQNENFN